MSTVYADRGFISINGNALEDIKSATVRQNHNSKAVPTMTRRKFNKGFVRGNTEIDVSFSLATQNQKARPKLEAIDYEANDVQLTFEVGADLYILTGLFPKDNEDSAPGTGSEVTASFNFGALEFTDAVGNSVLFNLDLG